LEASQQFSFLQSRVVAPRSTPIPEDQASVFNSPRGRMATHFSRLLRHAGPCLTHLLCQLQNTFPPVIPGFVILIAWFVDTMSIVAQPY
jgi:hypothetical protein